MIICSRCKTENNESSKFCCQCGNDLMVNVDAPANEELKKLADELNQKATNKQKKSLDFNKAILEIPKKIWAGIKLVARKTKNTIFFRKKKNTIITCSSMVLVTLLTIGILNSGYIAFTAAYSMGQYNAAKSIQGWPINSSGVKSNIEKFVINKTEEYYNDFFQ